MDTYAIVTEKIINLLEQGIVPWRRPMERNRTAAQPRIEKAVPGSQSVSAFGDKIRARPYAPIRRVGSLASWSGRRVLQPAHGSHHPGPRASFSPAPKKFMPAFSMRNLTRQVRRSDSTANRSPKPSRLSVRRGGNFARCPRESGRVYSRLARQTR